MSTCRHHTGDRAGFQTGLGTWICVAAFLICTQNASAEIGLVSQRFDAPASSNTADGNSTTPAISSDGNVIAFLSNAINLRTNNVLENTSIGTVEVFRFDVATSNLTPITPEAGGFASYPTLSGDGRYLAFISTATNLVPGDRPPTSRDVYLYDHQTEETRSLVEGSGLESLGTTFSANGTVLAFSSQATNVTVDAGGSTEDIFIYDVATELFECLTPDGNGRSYSPSLSADGRYVVFVSRATNLTDGDQRLSLPRIFRHDTLTGQTLEVPASEGGYTPFISADGDRIIYGNRGGSANPENLNGELADVFLYTVSSDEKQNITNGANGESLPRGINGSGNGVPIIQSTATSLAGDHNTNVIRIYGYDLTNASWQGLTNNSASDLREAVVSNGATRIVGASQGPLLGIPDDNFLDSDIYLIDRAAETVEIVSATNVAYDLWGGNRESSNAGISGDGRFIAFTTQATNLYPNDPGGGATDLVVLDRETNTIEPITSGANASDSTRPSISDNGDRISFDHRATNLLDPLQSDNVEDVFVYERSTSTLKMLTNGGPGNSVDAKISGDGNWVVFSSRNNTLVNNDTNISTDIFLYELDTDAITRLTEGANEGSNNATISTDGRYIAFQSFDDDLAGPNTPDSTNDIYLFDAVERELTLITGSAAGSHRWPAISGDGSRIVFRSSSDDFSLEDTNGRSDIYVWNRSDNSFQRITSDDETERMVSGPDISADGRFITYTAEDNSQALDFQKTGVVRFDLATGTKKRLSVPSTDDHQGPQISDDGTLVVFHSFDRLLAPDNNLYQDVFVVEAQTNTQNNAQPIANSLTLSTSIATPLPIVLEGSDPDGGTLVFEITNPPENGILSGSPPGVLYTPAANFLGADEFSFTVSDGDLVSDVARVQISVTDGTSTNTAPVANSAAYPLARNTPLPVTLTATDEEANTISFSIIAPPANGQLSGTPPELTYLPNEGFTGVDSFTFSANDGEFDSATARIDLTVITPSLAAAVLPSSRSVVVGDTATAFVTLLNPTLLEAKDCAIQLTQPLDVNFTYQTTDPTTNETQGSANTPVSIPPEGSQTFLIAITPNTTINEIEVTLQYTCDDGYQATSLSGINTLRLTAADTPVPDIIAIALTPSANGILAVGNETNGGTGIMVVGTANVGAAGTINARARIAGGFTGSVSLCPTDPVTSACLSPATASATALLPVGATQSFGVFVASSVRLPLDPAQNRLYIEFFDSTDALRGSTSAAITVASP